MHAYPRILPKNERTNSFLVLLGQKNEFFRSFFGRIQGYQKSFRNYLTFNSYAYKYRKKNWTEVEIEYIHIAASIEHQFSICIYHIVVLIKFSPNYDSYLSYIHNDRSFYFRAYVFPKFHYGQNLTITADLH